MAEFIMIQGVSSNSGKSVITKALCRYYYNKGVKVTTFKPVLVCVDGIISNGITTDIRLSASVRACNRKLTIHNNPIQIRPQKKDPHNNTLSPVTVTVEDKVTFEIGMLGRDTPLYNRLSSTQKNYIKVFQIYRYFLEIMT